jgi:hypothetical protein
MSLLIRSRFLVSEQGVGTQKPGLTLTNGFGERLGTR